MRLVDGEGMQGRVRRVARDSSLVVWAPEAAIQSRCSIWIGGRRRRERREGTVEDHMHDTATGIGKKEKSKEQGLPGMMGGTQRVCGVWCR